MELITLPEHAADGALCDSVRAVFHLQSQALKAALAQVDASQAQIRALQQQVDALRDGSQDAGEAQAAPSPTPPAHDPARAATVAAIAQIDAKTKKVVEQDEPAVTYDRMRNAVIALAVTDCLASRWSRTQEAPNCRRAVRVWYEPQVRGTSQ